MPEIVQEAVKRLEAFSRLFGLQTLFIAGGYCRALYTGHLETVKDIDVASAYADQAVQLGGLFASEILHTTPDFSHRTGTAIVNFRSPTGEIRIEFQGNSTQGYMQNEDVKAWMHTQSIPDMPLMNNIYGRDFTINSMIYSLSDGSLLDPTGRAEADFEKKVIISLLPPHLLVKYNPLVITRAIRFALAYDFRIDDTLRAAMLEGSNSLKQAVPHDRIVKELVRILKINAKDGLQMIKKYELDKYLMDPGIKSYVYLETR